MLKKFILVLFCLCSFLQVFGKNKIVYLISPPRSMSVAFMRMIEARKDFVIWHEPSQYPFAFERYKEVATNWYREGSAQTFAEVKENILKDAESHNVFVKEMSFAVQDFLLQEKELLADERVYFVFLVRAMHETLISFYEKTLPEHIALPEFPFFIGYEATYKLFKHIKQHAQNAPLIISSNELSQKPETVVNQFCQHVGIEFKKEALTWSSLEENFTGYQEWHEAKTPDKTYFWHGNAIKSTAFSKLTTYDIDECGMPTSVAISNVEAYKRAYDENLKFYNLLIAELKMQSIAQK